MLTNTILSERLDIPLTKIRRWTKEFLPPDPKATRRSGYTREFSNNDGFKIFLGGYLVSNLGFSFEDARKLIKFLMPWIEQNGLLPDIPPNAKRKGIDRQVSTGYQIVMSLENNPRRWQCLAEGFVRREGDGDTDSTGRIYGRIKEETITYLIGSYMGPKISDMGPKIIDRAIEISGPSTNTNQKIIPVSLILGIFNADVLQNTAKWFQNWKKLAEGNE